MLKDLHLHQYEAGTHKVAIETNKHYGRTGRVDKFTWYVTDGREHTPVPITVTHPGVGYYAVDRLRRWILPDGSISETLKVFEKKGYQATIIETNRENFAAAYLGGSMVKTCIKVYDTLEEAQAALPVVPDWSEFQSTSNMGSGSTLWFGVQELNMFFDSRRVFVVCWVGGEDVTTPYDLDVEFHVKGSQEGSWVHTANSLVEFTGGRAQLSVDPTEFTIDNYNTEKIEMTVIADGPFMIVREYFGPDFSDFSNPDRVFVPDTLKLASSTSWNVHVVNITSDCTLKFSGYNSTTGGAVMVVKNGELVYNSVEVFGTGKLIEGEIEIKSGSTLYLSFHHANGGEFYLM